MKSTRIVLSILALAPLHASTYYVSTSGNDANPGTLSAPFRNVSRGANNARAGDTVIIQNGTYGNEGHISDGSGGMHGYAAPVTLNQSGRMDHHPGAESRSGDPRLRNHGRDARLRQIHLPERGSRLLGVPGPHVH